MSDMLRCISPVDGSVYVERPLAGDGEIAIYELSAIVELEQIGRSTFQR